ncbi:MAG: polysaccharide deacetylase family protein [Gemmatimonadota bacterium]
MMRALALEYHDIVASAEQDNSGFPGPSSGSYKLAPNNFAEHVRAVTARGSVVTPRQALAGGALRPIMLTFDDGGLSASTVAAPILEGAGCRGVFLMTTDYIGKPTFLSRAQLRELHERGHVVGSHSCSHPVRMAALTRDALRREWRDSVKVLEDVIGAPIDTASVPGGYFSRVVAETAAEAGIRFLFTSEPSRRVVDIDGCAVIGRYTLRQWHGKEHAAGFVAPLSPARVSEWLRWNALKIAKRLLGERYLVLRGKMFRET